MKKSDLNDFIYENGLLSQVRPQPGIYAITIDNKVAYIGQSKNMWERCSQHIYNIENAMLNQEKKYLLLLAAKLGGHKIDCISIANCTLEGLIKGETYYIDRVKPPLNIKMPGNPDNNIDSLKIEDLLGLLEWECQ